MSAVIIVNHFKEVAQATNAALQVNGFGREVFNMYGHYKEITSELQKLSSSPTEGAKKFPMIMLLTDIVINRNIVGMYGTASLNILITNYTEATYTAPERTEKNFIPILHPIKEEFIKQLGLHPGFTFPDVPRFIETDLYYFGSQYNNKNVFNDRIDAIEIRNLQINLTNKIC